MPTASELDLRLFHSELVLLNVGEHLRRELARARWVVDFCDAAALVDQRGDAPCRGSVAAVRRAVIHRDL